MEALYFSSIKKSLNNMFYKLKNYSLKNKDFSYIFLLALELITYKALTLHCLKARWRVLTILKGDQRL